MMVSVSATVTAHNEAKYIAGCLDSIMAQTLPVSDISLIDDKSSDETVEIASQYPITIYQIEYGSTYMSKREGLFLAKNDIVLAVDGDTVLAKDFLERGLRHIEEGYSAATGAVHPNERIIEGDISAFIVNHLPSGVYFSGPGYVVDRRAYYKVCRVEQLEDGVYVDLCSGEHEIPLDKLNMIKDPEMHMWTELPSTGQKRMLVGARATAMLFSALRLLAK